MSVTPPVATKKSRTALIVISSVVGFIVLTVGLSMLVYLSSTAEMRAEVNTLKSDPIIADSITGLQETEVRFSKGGEAMGKRVRTEAFRFFKINDDLPLETVAHTIRKKAEESGWEFEREAHSKNGSFRMSKYYEHDGKEKHIDLFVSMAKPGEVRMSFTVN